MSRVDELQRALDNCRQGKTLVKRERDSLQKQIKRRPKTLEEKCAWQQKTIAQLAERVRAQRKEIARIYYLLDMRLVGRKPWSAELLDDEGR